MIVDVSDILKESGGKIPVVGSVTIDDTEFLGEHFHFLNPIELSGTIANNGKALVLKASAVGRIMVKCARCMKPIETDISFDINEFFAQDNGEKPDDEIIVFSGTEINIDETVCDNFFMNVQGKYLCSEDCRGLCPKCGKNLNDGDCDCQDDEYDPRWEALKKIMDKTDD